MTALCCPPLIHAPLAETGFSHNRMGHQLLGGRSVLAGASAGKNVVFLPRSGCCVTAKAPVGTCTLGEMDGKGCHWRELVALLRLLATPGWLKTPTPLKRAMLTKPAEQGE